MADEEKKERPSELMMFTCTTTVRGVKKEQLVMINVLGALDHFEKYDLSRDEIKAFAAEINSRICKIREYDAKRQAKLNAEALEALLYRPGQLGAREAARTFAGSTAQPLDAAVQPLDADDEQ